MIIAITMMKIKYCSDFGSPSVTWMFKRAGVASEKGRMPFENEAEILYLQNDIF